MKYKYNIRHRVDGKVSVINFKNKESMIRYLDKNTSKINKLTAPVLNFDSVMLPLKQTVWNESSTAVKPTVTTKKKTPRKKTAREIEKAAEKRRLKRFIKRLER